MKNNLWKIFTIDLSFSHFISCSWFPACQRVHRVFSPADKPVILACHFRKVHQVFDSCLLSGNSVCSRHFGLSISHSNLLKVFYSFHSLSDELDSFQFGYPISQITSECCQFGLGRRGCDVFVDFYVFVRLLSDLC
jgi:hypothetical protein